MSEGGESPGVAADLCCALLASAHAPRFQHTAGIAAHTIELPLSQTVALETRALARRTAAARSRIAFSGPALGAPKGSCARGARAMQTSRHRISRGAASTCTSSRASASRAHSRRWAQANVVHPSLRAASIDAPTAREAVLCTKFEAHTGAVTAAMVLEDEPGEYTVVKDVCCVDAFARAALARLICPLATHLTNAPHRHEAHPHRLSGQDARDVAHRGGALRVWPRAAASGGDERRRRRGNDACMHISARIASLN